MEESMGDKKGEQKRLRVVEETLGKPVSQGISHAESKEETPLHVAVFLR